MKYGRGGETEREVCVCVCICARPTSGSNEAWISNFSKVALGSLHVLNDLARNVRLVAWRPN